MQEGSTITDEGRPVAIRVQGVGKEFSRKQNGRSLKGAVIGLGSAVTGKKEKVMEDQAFRALQDISFDVYKGEFFGIVGRNGSGKSTLLKILAGVYAPSEGGVDINGKLTPFIELGVGFNPELTGHDNVFLNGALLGFSRKQMRNMYEEIVDFAELAEFMDVKLKNYSSGMQVRLAFSIATRCRSDILLLDEVLAVGDAVFQQKCFDYFAEIKKTGRTVCFVSHDAETLRKYCDRGVLIRNGKMIMIGNITSVLNEYQKDLNQTMEAQEAKAKKVVKPKPVKPSGVKLEAVKVYQDDAAGKASIRAYEPFNLSIDLHSEKPIANVNLGINILSQQGQLLHAFNTEQLGQEVRLVPGNNNITFKFQNILTDGKYDINLAVVDTAAKSMVCQVEQAGSFKIKGITGHKYSLIHPQVEVVG